MRRSIARVFLFACTLTALLGAQSCSVLNNNFRAVESGQFYRSAQMSGVKLDAVADWYNIKTVINLRGASPDEWWYKSEIAACEREDIVHHDLSWSMKHIPDPASLLQLVEWIQSEPRPILVHCQAGIHRAGVASAVYRLMRGDTVDQAREEFGIFFNDAPIGDLLDLYDGSKPFAQWVKEDYPKIYENFVAQGNGAK